METNHARNHLATEASVPHAETESDSWAHLLAAVDLRKVIEAAAIPVRLAAVGRISAHVTASYVTFGQIAAGSVGKGHPLPRGASYEDAV